MLQRADVGHYAKMFSVRLKLLVEVVMVKEGTVAADIGGHGCNLKSVSYNNLLLTSDTKHSSVSSPFSIPTLLKPMRSFSLEISELYIRNFVALVGCNSFSFWF